MSEESTGPVSVNVGGPADRHLTDEVPGDSYGNRNTPRGVARRPALAEEGGRGASGSVPGACTGRTGRLSFP